MKNAYLITNTAYKMLHQTSFLEIMHRRDKTNIQNQNTDLSNIDI